MSEPAVSMFSLLSLAYRDDDEMLAAAVDGLTHDEARRLLYISLKCHADEVAPERRAYAAALASANAARHAQGQP